MLRVDQVVVVPILPHFPRFKIRSKIWDWLERVETVQTMSSSGSYRGLAVLFFLFLAVGVVRVSGLSICGTNGYLDQRDAVFESEKQMYFAADEILSADEQVVNRYLEVLKQIDYNVNNFPPAHFFLDANYRTKIENSPTLPILKQMPKGMLNFYAFNEMLKDWDTFVIIIFYLIIVGGNLHIHLAGAGDATWAITYLLNQSYSQYLYYNPNPPQVGLYMNPATVPAGFSHLPVNSSTAAFLINGISYQPLNETNPLLFQYINDDSIASWVVFQQKFDFFSNVLR